MEEEEEDVQPEPQKTPIGTKREIRPSHRY
jgi:hypothetical protein